MSATSLLSACYELWHILCVRGRPFILDIKFVGRTSRVTLQYATHVKKLIVKKLRLNFLEI